MLDPCFVMQYLASCLVLDVLRLLAFCGSWVGVQCVAVVLPIHNCLHLLRSTVHLEFQIIEKEMMLKIIYSKTCLKRSLKNRQNNGFQDKW